MSTPTTPSARPNIWAETGTTVEPSSGLQSSGFIAGKPGRGVTNWILNWMDNAVQYLLANRGLLPWSDSDTYDEGAVVLGSDNIPYTALTASGPPSPKDPTTQHDYWQAPLTAESSNSFTGGLGVGHIEIAGVLICWGKVALTATTGPAWVNPEVTLPRPYGTFGVCLALMDGHAANVLGIASGSTLTLEPGSAPSGPSDVDAISWVTFGLL